MPDSHLLFQGSCHCVQIQSIVHYCRMWERFVHPNIANIMLSMLALMVVISLELEHSDWHGGARSFPALKQDPRKLRVRKSEEGAFGM
jgi:hypothetical protein